MEGSLHDFIMRLDSKTSLFLWENHNRKSSRSGFGWRNDESFCCEKKGKDFIVKEKEYHTTCSSLSFAIMKISTVTCTHSHIKQGLDYKK